MIGAEIAKATGLGRWVEYVWPNPVKATARRNPHDFDLAPPVKAPGVPENPGVLVDPKFGWIEFSTNGGKKKKKCGYWGLFCEKESFTRSIKYKWKKPGTYSVTATLYDKDGKNMIQ